MEDKINILNELKEAGAAFLINTDNKNHFFIPDFYFENLAANIMSDISIAALPSANTYVVPQGYFDNLSEIILEKISFRKNIPASFANEKNLYSVPEGYFNNLSDHIIEKIKKSNTNTVQQELEEISPLISKIPKANVYSVPEDYFDQIGSLINKSSSNIKQSAKVVSIGSKTRKWINYAVAASVAAIALTGGYYYYFNISNTNKTSFFTKMDVQKEVSGLSDDEITNYLKNNNNIAVYTNYSSDDQQQGMDIQSLIQNIPDDEIQQYLKNEPEANGTGGI